jgi:hypothetical protein
MARCRDQGLFFRAGICPSQENVRVSRAPLAVGDQFSIRGPNRQDLCCRIGAQAGSHAAGEIVYPYVQILGFTGFGGRSFAR